MIFLHLAMDLGTMLMFGSFLSSFHGAILVRLYHLRNED